MEFLFSQIDGPSFFSRRGSRSVYLASSVMVTRRYPLASLRARSSSPTCSSYISTHHPKVQSRALFCYKQKCQRTRRIICHPTIHSFFSSPSGPNLSSSRVGLGEAGATWKKLVRVRVTLSFSVGPPILNRFLGQTSVLGRKVKP